MTCACYLLATIALHTGSKQLKLESMIAPSHYFTKETWISNESASPIFNQPSNSRVYNELEYVKAVM